jgi:hypothetical protein
MKIRVAGRDRTDELGAALIERSRRRPDCGVSRLVANEADVLSLSACKDTSEYLRRHIELLRSRNCQDAALFDTPAGPGLLGRIMHGIRLLLWKLLRYQHDWTIFRQNATNVQLSYELEFEREIRARQIAELEERVRELEAALGGAGGEMEGDG